MHAVDAISWLAATRPRLARELVSGSAGLVPGNRQVCAILRVSAKEGKYTVHLLFRVGEIRVKFGKEKEQKKMSEPKSPCDCAPEITSE